MKSSQIPALPGKPPIEKFVSLVQAGIELWSSAGQLLVEMVNNDPNVYSEIMKRATFITFEMLLAFEKMGRKQIYPPLLMDNSPGAKRLLELPYDIQERFCKEPLDVVVEVMESGEVKKQHKYVKELSEFESRMVFNGDSVRSIPDQADFKKTHSPRGRQPYTKKEDKENFIGNYSIKVSPSGAVVLEKSKSKLASKSLFLRELEGSKQITISLFK